MGLVVRAGSLICRSGALVWVAARARVHAWVGGKGGWRSDGREGAAKVDPSIPVRIKSQ
ncbi:MAG TPA: hypothetical protein PLY74_13775 [Methanothrix soehngenii]|nr:hypothetical protein [Methanothrix soehngenii]